ncbi:MAG: hypothetical protein Q9160_006634 [Pyrenula sp. 1 TL-2023]
MKFQESCKAAVASSFVLFFVLSVNAVPLGNDGSENLSERQDPGLGRRENACIALNNCPQFSTHTTQTTKNPPPSSSDPPPPPSSNPPPSTSAPTQPKITTESIDPYIYKCDGGQKKLIQEAWDEAKTLSEAHYKWQPPGLISNGAYQPAMSLYLGEDTKKDWSFFFGDGPLKRNTRRQYAVHHSTDNHPWAYTYIYCNEDSVPNKPNKPKKPQCSNPSNPKRVVAAYTFDDLGTVWWNAHYVVLCPQWFVSVTLG